MVCILMNMNILVRVNIEKNCDWLFVGLLCILGDVGFNGLCVGF